jgi:hypothetical protein
MPRDIKKELTPAYWHKRAEEAMVLAERMTDNMTRTLMMGVADDYKRIAEQTERRLAKKINQL